MMDVSVVNTWNIRIGCSGMKDWGIVGLGVLRDAEVVEGRGFVFGMEMRGFLGGSAGWEVGREGWRGGE